MDKQSAHPRSPANASRFPVHVIVTGATSGLGWALAEHYAAPGRTLSLSGRNAERLAAIARLCQDKGAIVETRRVDVTDAAAMHGWLTERDEVLPADILLANAGMGGGAVIPSTIGEDGPLAREILSINTFGAINSVTPLLPRMVARRAGHLVLVGSISGWIGLPQSPVYCASKAAVQVYGDAIRRLVRHHNVRVTNVLPGFVDTPMSRSTAMPRPWCWPAGKAARRIARDVGRGVAHCSFPWQLRYSIALQNFVPVGLMDIALSLTTRTGWANTEPPAASPAAPEEGAVQPAAPSRSRSPS